METKVIVIGFTGPSGSGKSTLATWLAKEGLVDIPNSTVTYIEGSASLTHLEEDRKYLIEKYNYKPKGHRNVINMSSTNPEFGHDFQKLLIKGRATRLRNLIKEKEELNDGKLHFIITDRTFLDIMVYTTTQCGHNLSQQHHTEIINKCRDEQLSIFNLPVIVPPNEGWTEDNGSRVTNNLYQNAGVMPVVDYFGNELYTHRSMINSQGVVSYIKKLHGWDLNYRKNTVKGFVEYLLVKDFLEFTNGQNK